MKKIYGNECHRYRTFRYQNRYSFNLNPIVYGEVTVNIVENPADGAASNGNKVAQQFIITYRQPVPVTLESYSVKAENNAAKLE